MVLEYEIKFTHEVEEKRPERPPSKSPAPLYPILNKYSEKVTSIKELTTSKVSLHKENTLSKESSTASTVTHTNKSESEKIIHNESGTDNADGQVKKPPVPTKKSPTPVSGVSSLFSGIKNKMLSSDKSEKEKISTTTVSSNISTSTSASNSSADSDKLDGAAPSKTQTNTFDNIERNSILNDPRAGRVKPPGRRRPPSQALRDDTPAMLGLSNGHDVPTEKPPPPTEEIKPRTREWEKHRAPWMAELKLNQQKKTDTKHRTNSQGSDGGLGSKGSTGSTDRLIEVGLEEKKTTHSMEMSKSTHSISSRIFESFEEIKSRNSLEPKKDPAPPAPKETEAPHKNVQSPTAAGRTFQSMLEEVQKPPERTAHNNSAHAPAAARSPSMHDSLERSRAHDTTHTDMIAQLTSRIATLEKQLEARDAKYKAALKEVNAKLELEIEKRLELQAEVQKLAHCVTQV